jgi:hypothetical protein
VFFELRSPKPVEVTEFHNQVLRLRHHQKWGTNKQTNKQTNKRFFVLSAFNKPFAVVALKCSHVSFIICPLVLFFVASGKKGKQMVEFQMEDKSNLSFGSMICLISDTEGLISLWLYMH